MPSPPIHLDGGHEPFTKELLSKPTVTSVFREACEEYPKLIAAVEKARSSYKLLEIHRAKGTVPRSLMSGVKASLPQPKLQYEAAHKIVREAEKAFTAMQEELNGRLRDTIMQCNKELEQAYLKEIDPDMFVRTKTAKVATLLEEEVKKEDKRVYREQCFGQAHPTPSASSSSDSSISTSAAAATPTAEEASLSAAHPYLSVDGINSYQEVMAALVLFSTQLHKWLRDWKRWFVQETEDKKKQESVQKQREERGQMDVEGKDESGKQPTNEDRQVLQNMEARLSFLEGKQTRKQQQPNKQQQEKQKQKQPKQEQQPQGQQSKPQSKNVQGPPKGQSTKGKPNQQQKQPQKQSESASSSTSNEAQHQPPQPDSPTKSKSKQRRERLKRKIAAEVREEAPKGSSTKAPKRS